MGIRQRRIGRKVFFFLSSISSRLTSPEKGEAEEEGEPICLKSVERNPIRLRSVIRPTTTRRQSCIDEKTGIEHRVSDTGRWLPVLGSAHRTGKERIARAKARKSKAPSQAPAEAFDPGVQNQYLWKPPKEELCGSGLTRAYWRERASGSGSAGSKE